MTREQAYIIAHDQVHQYIRTHGMRKSADRDLVLFAMYSLTGMHTVDEIHEQLVRTHPRNHPSRTTVYNSLELFHQLGLVMKHNLSEQQFYYEVNLGDACHIFTRCTICGQINKIRDRHIRESLLSKHYTKFTPVPYEVVINGICKKCSQKGKNKK